MKFYFSTLGCRANFAESQFWEDLVLKHGGETTTDIKEAQVCILNTCTVTDTADKKSRKEIKNILKINPELKVLVTGCANDSIKSDNPFPENVKVISRLVLPSEIKKTIKDSTEQITYQTSNLSQIKTRAFLKIQDGCNNFCAYCIIPQTRGRERSFEAKDVINEVNKRVKQGYKEIVLTGIHLSNWGSEHDFKYGELADLVQSILDETSIKRIRFGSLEPRFFNQKFVDILNSKRVCPHLHLSLQSGSNEILKLMHRHYSKEEYQKMIQVLFDKVKDFSLTTDIIVGFPGETDELFYESYEFVKSINFSKLHIFSYSKRQETLAAGMKDQIDEKTKKERSKLFRKLSDDKQRYFLNKMIGKEYSILIEEKRSNSSSGLTPNYAKIWIGNNLNFKRNEIVKVTPTKIVETDNILGLEC